MKTLLLLCKTCGKWNKACSESLVVTGTILQIFSVAYNFILTFRRKLLNFKPTVLYTYKTMISWGAEIKLSQLHLQKC